MRFKDVRSTFQSHATDCIYYWNLGVCYFFGCVPWCLGSCQVWISSSDRPNAELDITGWAPSCPDGRFWVGKMPSADLHVPRAPHNGPKNKTQATLLGLATFACPRMIKSSKADLERTGQFLHDVSWSYKRQLKTAGVSCFNVFQLATHQPAISNESSSDLKSKLGFQWFLASTTQEKPALHFFSSAWICQQLQTNPGSWAKF